jgi:hypothetical protein
MPVFLPIESACPHQSGQTEVARILLLSALRTSSFIRDLRFASHKPTRRYKSGSVKPDNQSVSRFCTGQSKSERQYFRIADETSCRGIFFPDFPYPPAPVWSLNISSTAPIAISNSRLVV